MYEAFRLVQPPHHSLADSFSGEGASEVGGRWNRRGTPVVYFSENYALAALEKLTTITHEYRALELSFYRLVFEGEPRLTRVDREDLPGDWHTQPPPSSTREVGTQWAVQQESLFLEVPSVVMPYERNILARPDILEHPDVTVRGPQPFAFDRRVMEKGGS